MPSTGQVSTVACPLNGAIHVHTHDMIAQQYSPAIQAVVDFGRALPGMNALKADDSVTLLKVCCEMCKDEMTLYERFALGRCLRSTSRT